VLRLVLGCGGRWEDTALALPPGRWHDVLGEQDVVGGRVPLANLLARFPVALLIREEGG
jgi:(1->4)-alpha-D-glucan 1-alpha-D-glucosylmutase